MHTLAENLDETQNNSLKVIYRMSTIDKFKSATFAQISMLLWIVYMLLAAIAYLLLSNRIKMFEFTETQFLFGIYWVSICMKISGIFGIILSTVSYIRGEKNKILNTVALLLHLFNFFNLEWIFG